MINTMIKNFPGVLFSAIERLFPSFALNIQKFYLKQRREQQRRRSQQFARLLEKQPVSHAFRAAAQREKAPTIATLRKQQFDQESTLSLSDQLRAKDIYQLRTEADPAASSPLGGPTRGILTAREEEVVRLIVAGKTAERAAREALTKRISITAASLKDQAKSALSSCGIVAVGGLIWYIYGTPSVWTATLLIGVAACPLLDFWLTKFRFEHGYYGNNEREARELIAFILKNSDKFDPGDGNLRIFEPEQDRTKTSPATVPSGQVA
jgi:hypothetical protein